MKTTTFSTNDKTFTDVILTAGMTDSRGRQLISVFADEADTRDDDADKKAIAILFAGDLPAAQMQLAEANSAEI